jgi:hypothetical protein
MNNQQLEDVKYHKHLGVTISKYNKNRRESNIDPCGTPAFIYCQDE